MMRTSFITFVTIAAALATACNSRANVQCEVNSNCDLSAGGLCSIADTGNHWCAYPDSNCPSGYRYSDQDVGDGVSGICIANPPSVLTVTVSGNGMGRVTSAPSGIDCPGTCSASFAKGTKVTLSETSTTSVFMGWSDACTSDCKLTLDTDKHVNALFSVPGSNIWLSQFHASMRGDISAVKALSNNDIIVAGSFLGTMSIGDSPLILQSDGSSFVARLRGSDGSLIWINQLDGSQSVLAKLIDVDSRNDVFVAGQFANTAVFNGVTATSAGRSDVFIAKLSGVNGKYLWVHTFGDPDADLATGMTVDHTGDVSLTGWFNGTITPGPNPLTGTNATFVVKYNGATGAHAWSKPITSDAQLGVFSSALAVDKNGNAIIIGLFYGSVNFGGGSVSANNAPNSFLVKYASENGAYILDREFSSQITARSVASDSAGNIYLLGSFTGALTLASPLTSAGDTDIFIVKYSASGVPQWSRSFGNSLRDNAGQITVDPGGQLLLSTSFQGTESYGGPTFVAAGDTDVIIARMRSQDGSYLGSIQLGGLTGEYASAVGSPGGNVFVSGGFSGTATFGGQMLTSPSSSNDGFLLLVVPLNP